MKKQFLAAAILSVVSSWLGAPALALDGQVSVHDPSTIVICDGKYYTFATGGGSLMSDDGWTWRAGPRAPRNAMGPDAVFSNGRYYVYCSTNVGGQPRAEIGLVSTKSLDPNSPDYGWTDHGVIGGSDGVEDCNAIDPGVFVDPTDGRMWLTYGSYFGYIRLEELDPKTGMRLNPSVKPVDLAINCEASIIIFHEGWYYLLATHLSCCRSTDSNYNIRAGRAKKVTGPFLDHEGVDMIKGGGKLVCGSGGRVIGPGHFGFFDEGGGVQKFSLHYEADLDRGGASVLDVRPLLWKDGWPVAGDHLKEGTYQIEAARFGTALEMAVQGQPVGGGGRGGGGPRRGGAPGTPGGAPGAAPGGMPGQGAQGNVTDETLVLTGFAGGAPGGRAGRGGGAPIPPQEASQVAQNWAAGNVNLRLTNYMLQAQQKWTIAPAPNAGGYLGAPYFKITIAGTDRALAATADGELVCVPLFTGAPEQLWRIDLLTDGTYRIMPKAIPNSRESLALSAIGASSVTLSKFDPKSNKNRWNIKAP